MGICRRELRGFPRMTLSVKAGRVELNPSFVDVLLQKSEVKGTIGKLTPVLKQGARKRNMACHFCNWFISHVLNVQSQ